MPVEGESGRERWIFVVYANVRISEQGPANIFTLVLLSLVLFLANSLKQYRFEMTIENFLIRCFLPLLGKIAWLPIPGKQTQR